MIFLLQMSGLANWLGAGIDFNPFVRLPHGVSPCA